MICLTTPKRPFGLAALLFLMIAPQHLMSKNEKILQSDKFEGDLNNWVVEQQPGGEVKVEDGAMLIHDKKGCTVWFRHELHAPVKISYTVKFSAEERV